MKIFTILVSTLAFTFAVAGCSSDPPPKEETRDVREAICSGGGGGGGDDPCTGGGYCPAECGYCFTSVSQRIQLQNLWECTGTGGGGGGGGGGACSSPTSYNGWGDGYSDDQSTAQQDADRNAKSQSESTCSNSAQYCTAHVGSTSVSGLGCSEVVTPGYYHWHCRSQATTSCTYTYF